MSNNNKVPSQIDITIKEILDEYLHSIIKNNDSTTRAWHTNSTTAKLKDAFYNHFKKEQIKDKLIKIIEDNVQGNETGLYGVEITALDIMNQFNISIKETK